MHVASRAWYYFFILLTLCLDGEVTSVTTQALLYAAELISKQEPTCKATYKSEAGGSRNQITVLFCTYKYLYRSVKGYKAKNKNKQTKKNTANLFILIFLFLVYFP